MSDRLNMTSTCHGCGLRIEQAGDDAVRVLRAIDAAHDVLKPDCPETAKRSVAASSPPVSGVAGNPEEAGEK